MSIVTSIIGKEHYKVKMSSTEGNELIADEPVAKGGKNEGFNPKELLAASLGSCIAITLRMYADRKEWDLKEVKVVVELIADKQTNQSVINKKLEFTGELDDSQKDRLMVIATKCPIHKMLSKSIKIN